MIKLNISASRVPGLTQAQFGRYLRDQHARLVIGTEAVSRYLVQYHQQHVFDAAYGLHAPAWRWDSVAHLWTRSIEDQMAAVSTPEYREIIAPDEPRFADARSATPTVLAQAPMALAVAGHAPHRLLYYGKAREGVAAADLQAQWSDAHAALQAADAAVLRGVRRAVLNRPLPGPAAPTFDVMAELGFVDRSDAPALCDYVAMMQAQLAAVLDAERSFFLLCDTVVLKDAGL